MALLIFIQPDTDAQAVAALSAQLAELGHGVATFAGREGTRLSVWSRAGEAMDRPAIEKIAAPHKVDAPAHKHLFSSRQVQQTDTVIDLGDGVNIGGEGLALIAGPCAVESEEQVFQLAQALSDAGVSILRGGIYKPRTSPFSFQGLQEPGFALMRRVREATGLKFVTEAMDEASLELVEEHADMIQVGARNMHNFALLKKVGRARKPVLLKRGFSATVDELLLAADYIMSGGNTQVALCERGIRTFADHTRNTLDLNAVPALRELSHLPVVVDPSHGVGVARFVPDLALASAAVGADGIMLEVHNRPEAALSDGQQSLSLDAFRELLPRLERVSEAVSKPLTLPAGRV